MRVDRRNPVGGQAAGLSRTKGKVIMEIRQLVGASSVERLQASLAAAGMRLSPEEMDVLSRLTDWQAP